MTDPKDEQEKRDRPPLASHDDYGFRYLAERTGISTDQVREAIERYDNDRDKKKPTN